MGSDESALVLLAKTGRFRCIRLPPPPGFSCAERFGLKLPGLQLCAGDTRLPGNAALCRARFIKSLNRCCLILVRIGPSMVSRFVPLSWTGVKYPGVRKQGRSSASSRFGKVAGRQHGKRGTSSRPCQKTPRALPMPYALTGELKTASTGCLMSPSAMTTAGYEKITHPPTSPSSGTSQ